jgi:hypothetical protein
MASVVTTVRIVGPLAGEANGFNDTPRAADQYNVSEGGQSAQPNCACHDARAGR